MPPHGWDIAIALLAGFGLSVVVGWPVVWGFHFWMKSRLGPEPKSHKRVSPHITGLIERTVFTALVIAQPENAVVAMGGWMALKMAAAWNKDMPTHAPDTERSKQIEEKLNWNSYGFLGLLTGFVAMTFAGAGGALARYLLGLPIVDGWPS